MAVRIEEHLEKMRQLKGEIKSAAGYHKKDLVRQYNKMVKELKTAQQHLKQRER